MKTQRSAAFTLIELLVVIAIIAILAAILFPVFAQAKLAAKKAAAISQYKQTGTSIILYTSDADDQFPLGSVPNLTTANVTYRNTDFTPLTPAGWNNDAVARAEHELVWANSTFPYHKSYDVMLAPATNVTNLTGAAFTYSTASRTPKAVSMSFNGLMQYMSTTAIEAQSRLTMLWPGFGNAANNGAAFLSPRLNCNSASGGVCMFNPGGVPQAGATGNPQIFSFSFTPTYHVYGRGNVHVFADSSAKFVVYSNGNRAPVPASTNSNVVWQFLDDARGNIPTSPGAFFRGMGGLRGANYAAAFCPDNSFSN